MTDDVHTRKERVRYIAAGWPDYTTNPSYKMREEPEPVNNESLGKFVTDASRKYSVEYRAPAKQEQAEHGIRAILTHYGPTASATVKAWVSLELDCDHRTVERAAKNMMDIVRTGRPEVRTWSLNDTTVHIDGGSFSLRHEIDRGLFGDYQSPIASDVDLAAEVEASGLTGLVDRLMRSNGEGEPPYRHRELGAVIDPDEDTRYNDGPPDPDEDDPDEREELI